MFEHTCFKMPEGTLIDPILARNAMGFKKSINVFCHYRHWHHMVGCITKLQIPPAKSHKVTYRSFWWKYFQGRCKSYSLSQICNIFNDVSDQYWATNCLFTEVLNEHAPLKERTIKEDHVPYMHSNLRKEMYKRNMLKINT